MRYVLYLNVSACMMCMYVPVCAFYARIDLLDFESADAAAETNSAAAGAKHI